jgi:outer membrane murein-binding lipoprotein Lpp
MPEEMLSQQLQELSSKVDQLTETVRGLESKIGEQVKANIQSTEAMVKSLVASNPNAEGVLTGTLDALKKLL